MEAGTYKTLSFEDYQKIDAVNASALKEVKKSLGHYKYYLDNPSEDTDSKKFGRAIHTAILEPELFDSQFCCRPEGIDRRTKQGKEDYAAFEAANAGKDVLTVEEWQQIEAMQRVAARHETLQLLLPAADKEVTLVAEINGVLCKGRLDAFDGEMIVDLKTTRATSDTFWREVVSYQYHISAAMYRRLALELGYPIPPVVFVCIEKTAPYSIYLRELSAETLVKAGMELSRRLELVRQAKLSGEYPSYPEQIEVIDLLDSQISNVVEEAKEDEE